MSIDRTEVAPPGDSPSAPKKSGLSLGCQIFLGLGLVTLLLFIVGVVMVVNSVSWVANAQQPAPLQFDPVEISAKDELELKKMGEQLKISTKNEQIFDVKISPRQLNAFIQEQQKQEAENNATNSKKEPLVRFAFEEKSTVFRASFPTPQKTYVNLEVAGDINISEGKPVFKLDRIKLGGQEAPYLVRAFLDTILNHLEKATLQEMPPEVRKVLLAVKLLKREGDEIHLILDGQVLKELQEEQAQRKSNKALDVQIDAESDADNERPDQELEP